MSKKHTGGCMKHTKKGKFKTTKQKKDVFRAIRKNSRVKK